MLNIKRTEDSKFTSWFFEIDRRLLGCLLILVVIGVIYAVSAGSVAAERIGEPWYFFIRKALPFYCIGLTLLFAFSALNKKWVVFWSFINLAVGLILLGVTLFAPHVIKGSARFVHLGLNVMPSDIMKPGFVIITAWFLAKMKEIYKKKIFLSKDAWRPKLFSWWTYIVLFIPALVIIFFHPDFGTAILYLAVLVGMLFIAGLSWRILWPIIFGGIGLTVCAFFTLSHVHRRVMAFLTGKGDTFQVHQSIQAIQHGGLLGSGDDAFIKQSLPDSHTDFIFATIAEDKGAIVACVVLCLLLYIIKRLITDSIHARSPFVSYAVGGAALLFGSQVCINLISTLGLFPPKGMTLPFISYGGSSFVSYCFLFGCIIALVREDKWGLKEAA